MIRRTFFARLLAALGLGGIVVRDGEVLGSAAPPCPDCTTTPGTTYFVDLVDGDDSKDGLSMDTAFKDPGRAIEMCTPGHGDVIFFQPPKP